jgi:hypothetical protein
MSLVAATFSMQTTIIYYPCRRLLTVNYVITHSISINPHYKVLEVSLP